MACSNSFRLAGSSISASFCDHLLVFLLRLQEFTWIADRDRAREGVDMLNCAEHFFNGHAQHRLSITRKMKILLRIWPKAFRA